MISLTLITIIQKKVCLYNKFLSSAANLLGYAQSTVTTQIQLQFITHATFPPLLKKGVLDMAYTLNRFGDKQ